MRARANCLLHPTSVCTRLAVGTITAWVGFAEILVGEGAAPFEGMAGHAPGAGANRLVVVDLAVSALTTCSLTRVDALQQGACLVIRAVVMIKALSCASVVGISRVVLWTSADGLVVPHFADGILATRVATAWVDTHIVPAGLRG